MMEISHKYDDIIDLPHHVSETRAHMPMHDRAAQFSPFAALTGYSAAIEETARLTEPRRELTEEQKLLIDRRLRDLQLRIKAEPALTVVYFQPDSRKAGGAYLSIRGRLKRVDEYAGVLELTDGTQIPLRDLLSLDESPEAEHGR